MAALSTKAGYAACRELGSEAGCMIESQHGIRAVAVHPSTDLLAIGTGRKVPDTVSQAIAEVQPWSTDGTGMRDNRRLPGSCVINIPWVHHEGSPCEWLHPSCSRWQGHWQERAGVVLDSGSLKMILGVTTETRNQRGGFDTLLDPQLPAILDSAEIPEVSGPGAISAWPERRELSEAQTMKVTVEHSDQEMAEGLELTGERRSARRCSAASGAASAREKSISHGHPSTLHLWWTRRPAACPDQRAGAVEDPA